MKEQIASELHREQMMNDINAVNGFTIEELKKWESDGLIKYLGESDDIRSILLKSDCVVLPSYYNEGVPRILLEAASMEIPLITSNHPGCRDAVENKMSGYICEKNNPKDLADKMELIISMNHEEKQSMGLVGRKKMIDEFDEKIILDKYINKITDLY